MAEYNLIQAPDLLRRVARMLGLKQPHISPTLNEGVQPVIMVADVSKEPSAIPRTYFAGGNLVGDAINNAAAMMLVNPPGSDIVARVLYFSLGLIAAGAAQQFKADITTQQVLPTLQETIRGKNLRNGGSTAATGGAQLSVQFGGGGSGDHLLTRYVPAIGKAGNEVYVWEMDLTSDFYDFFLLPGNSFFVGMDQATNDSGYGSIAWREQAFDPSLQLPVTRLGVG